MKSLAKKVFNDDFIYSYVLCNSISKEEFYIGKNLHCTRIVFQKEVIEKSYTCESKIGNVLVRKNVFPKLIKVKSLKEHEYSDPFLQEIENRICRGYLSKTIDPAPIGEWPIWFMNRQLQRSSKVILFYSDEFEEPEDEIGRITFPHRVEKGDDFIAVEREFGISLRSFPYIKKSIILIFPYSASILHWRIFEKKPGWEGLLCKLAFDRFLYPFPEFRLKCILFDKGKKGFFKSKKYIRNGSKLMFRFTPSKKKAREIHKVDLKLYEGEKLIDDQPGVPIRKIEIGIEIKRRNGLT